MILFFFGQALQTVFEHMGEMETEFPLIRSYVSTFAARSITGQIVTLNDLAEPLENGAHYPLFLISLQQMHKIKSKDWLTNMFNESKLDLIKMLPGICNLQIIDIYVVCTMVVKAPALTIIV